MLLKSSLRQPSSEALSLSQQTAQHLRNHANTGTSTIPLPFMSAPESTELWLTYERSILSCLRTGDDEAAHSCLQKLIDRFGAANERVMGLRGLYQEAVAQDDSALEKVLKGYNDVLDEDPVNTPVAKRRIALLQTLSRCNDAIDALRELLESSPTDIEAWVELADLYLSQNLFSQAIFCLEEVLLVAPNAWNIHAQLGEALFMSATSGKESIEVKELVDAMRRFCRSIELCDDYIRGYYGLMIASDRLLSTFPVDEKMTTHLASADTGDLPMPLLETVHRLNERATSKLAEVTRQTPDNAQHAAEIVAAKALLHRSTQIRQR